MHALLLGLTLGIGAGRERLLRGPGYRWALRGSAVLLLAAGTLLITEAITRL